MKKRVAIILTQGKVAYVDDEDYDKVKNYKWYARQDSTNHNNWYAVTNIKHPTSKTILKYTLRMHHLILPRKPGFIHDHKDRDGLNNCKSNLRHATSGQNISNGRHQKRNPKVSPYRGVTKQTHSNSYYAEIHHNKKRYYLGSFKSPIEAAMIWDAKAKELKGEFAVLNNVSMMEGV